MKKNIMAILTGINTKLRGSIGQYTFTRLGGQTVAKEKVERKETPVRTPAQMLRRMRWANIIAMWRSFKGSDHPSFESKDTRQSDYNMFVAANMSAQGVFLHKDVASQGGGVVAPYQVTRGSLPSVGGAFNEGGIFVSTISLGGTTIGASTTLATFSQALVDNNADWRNGDQLSIYVMAQLNEGDVPRIDTRTFELTLDTADDSSLLGDMLDANLLSAVDGKLALGQTLQGGATFVHSRKAASKTLVSTQFIVVHNTLLASYQSRAAWDRATLSYGGINREDFLTPNVSTDYDFQG